MEMSQWNTLCNYLKQMKMPFLKNREQEGKIGPNSGLVSVGGGKI
jgi:hypothetical protein